MITAFEAAARHQNFARAAAELNLTQSAVSHSIRALEARMGAPLFDRHGRRVALTEDGGRLAERIRASLAMLAEAFGEVAPAAGPRRLIIGVPPEFAARVLFSRLAAERPLDSCEVRIHASLSALSDGSADLVITRGFGRWPALASRPLGRDRLLPVAAPALAGRMEATGFAQARLIENLAHPWRLWFAELGLPNELDAVSLVVDDWGLAIDAAVSGRGVCLARLSLIRDELDRGRLVRVGALEVPLEDGYHLLWNPGAPRHPQASLMIEWLLTELTVDGGRPAREPERGRLRVVEAQPGPQSVVRLIDGPAFI